MEDFFSASKLMVTCSKCPTFQFSHHSFTQSENKLSSHWSKPSCCV